MILFYGSFITLTLLKLISYISNIISFYKIDTVMVKNISNKYIVTVKGGIVIIHYSLKKV